MFSDIDTSYMQQALALAAQGLGRVAPNPAVGCVIVKDGKVIGQGRTADGGRPHAEAEALKQAGDAAQGATVYVTLEPCFHEGATPPCAKTLVEAQIGRVIVSCADPDPRTAGRGIEALRAAGIEVDVGLLADEAQALNKGFFLKILEQRPLVALKTATSADEKIAGSPGRWITGEEARAEAHLIRSRYEAILVGIGTVLADDPLLTTRAPNMHHDIIRVVIDPDLTMPPECKLIQTASPENPVIILHRKNKGADTLQKEGIILQEAADVKVAMKVLAERGITRLLVEGGAKTHTAFVEAGLMDEVFWFKAPDKIGPAGLGALIDRRWDDVVASMTKQETKQLGKDLLEIYTAKA